MIPVFFLTMALQAPSSAVGSDVPPAKLEKLLQDCDAHKFETIVDTVVDGQPHQSKVKLCGTKGQTDAAWMNMLKDAIVKIKANTEMAPETRNQIASALDAELERLAHPDSMALIANSAPAPSILKPSPIAGLAPALSATSSAARPLSQDYGSLPPLPAPKTVATSVAVGSILPTLPPPRMTLRCGSADDPNFFSVCDTITGDTILFVRADEQLPAGTSLRFVRRDDPRGEVALAALRSGQTARIALPHLVCNGVVRSKLQIEVLRKPKGANANAQVVDSLGPYDLHC